MNFLYEGPEYTMNTPIFVLYFTTKNKFINKEIDEVIINFKNGNYGNNIIIANVEDSIEMTKFYEVLETPSILVLQNNNVIDKIISKDKQYVYNYINNIFGKNK